MCYKSIYQSVRYDPRPLKCVSSVRHDKMAVGSRFEPHPAALFDEEEQGF
ncbi:hypothetical protein RRG08_013992, partial [Elysia crispata]